MKIKKPAIMVLFLAFGALALPFGANAVVDWTKYASNPVLTPGGAGTWDEEYIERPALIKDDATYKMWYGGSDDTVEQIGYATSTDGITWVKHGSNPVLQPSGTGWDSAHVGYCWVVKDGATYKMWYTGTDNASDETNYQIGYATSIDGITWNKYGGNPVLTKGATNDWDSLSVQWPSVIKDGGTYKMWYAGWNVEGGYERIGYATSTDGITWTKYNDPSTTTNPYANSDPVLTQGPLGAWDARCVGDPSVIKEDGAYRMWFFAEDASDTERIGYASSTDGINWTKYAGNPVLSEGGAGDFDDSDVWGPMVINDPGNTYKMWYVGEDSSENGGIGYATSQGMGDELAVSFASGGLWHYDHSGPTWAGIGGPALDLENFQGDLAVDFGGTGLWVYDGAWSGIGGNPDAMEACGSALYVDFGTTGLWRYDGAWSGIGGNPDAMQCCGGALYVDFGATGLWQYNGAWSGLAGNPTGMWCANGALYANLSGSLWKYDGAWSGVGGAAEGVEGCGSNIYVDFGATGLWRYNGAWSGIGGNPQAIKCCGGTLYVDYGGTGLWRYNGSWSGLAGDTEDLCCADALYVDFATGGLWRYDGSWAGLGGDTTVMTDVDINP